MAKRINLDILSQILLDGLPRPEPEVLFHPQRQWAFDWAWPKYRLGLEIDGGVFTQGRHTRGAGYTEDAIKLNEALILGWFVLRVTTSMVHDGRAIDFIRRTLLSRGWKPGE